MIKTAAQLKAKVRNLSGGDSTKAQALIRNFIMERFPERINNRIKRETTLQPEADLIRMENVL